MRNQQREASPTGATTPSLPPHRRHELHSTAFFINRRCPCAASIDVCDGDRLQLQRPSSTLHGWSIPSRYPSSVCSLSLFLPRISLVDLVIGPDYSQMLNVVPHLSTPNDHFNLQFLVSSLVMLSRTPPAVRTILLPFCRTKPAEPAAWPRTHPVAPAVQCPWPVRRATIASLQLRTMSQAGRRPRGLRREPTPYDRADCHRPCQCPAAARAAASLGGRAAADALQLRVLAPYSSAAAACRWILIRGTACVRTHPHLRAKKTDHMRTK
jgi:hypothetical protein